MVKVIQLSRTAILSSSKNLVNFCNFSLSVGKIVKNTYPEVDVSDEIKDKGVYATPFPWNQSPQSVTKKSKISIILFQEICTPPFYW